MIIDFHTHVFPENLADTSIKKLETNANIKSTTDGTLKGLKASMLEANIDLSIVLPVVTNPSQTKSINEYAASITDFKKVISFGGIHPDSEDYMEDLKFIKSLNLRGIKLHPDYQNTFIDSDKYLKIISAAIKFGFIVSIHSGLDIGLPAPSHCTPERALNMIDFIRRDLLIQKSNIILAHTGGFQFWEDSLKLLAGQNVFFDISYTLGHITDDLFMEIVKKHTAKKIIFGSDSPWAGQKETLSRFMSLPLTQEQRDQILWKNAAKMLKLSV